MKDVRDPLTVEELEAISAYFNTNVLKDVSVPDDAMYARVDLVIPDKYNKNPKRLVNVDIYYYAEDIYNHYVVHLEKGVVHHVEGPKRIDRARPAYSCPDEAEASNAVINDKRFRKALIRHGVKEEEINTFVYLDVAIDGRLDDCEKKSCKCSDKLDCQGEFRIIKETKPRPHSFYVTPYWNDGLADTTAAYSQPINGVYAIYDRRTKKVLKVVDEKEVDPIQKGNLDWKRPEQPGLKPFVSGFPEGPSYKVDGYNIEWQGLKFHWGFSSIFGPILYEISFLDRTVWRVDPNAKPVRRSIIDQIHMSELITGYAGVQNLARAKNFADVSEYPAREFLPGLVKGVDIPHDATTFSVPVTLADGSVFVLEDAIAVYEYSDGPLWRHYNYTCTEDARQEGRAARKLAFVWAPVIANYDYLMGYHFNQVGDISLKGKATGVMECKGSKFVKTNDAIVGSTLVRPNVVALNHWHLASFRINFAVDGRKNRIAEKNIRLQPLDPENPCGNLFEPEETLLETEGEAIRDTKAKTARAWEFLNDHSHNYLGHHRAYELKPSTHFSPVINECARIAKRATYIKHDLFVTNYRPDEMYAIGEYPIERSHDTGIGSYIREDESIVDRDLVAWYTVGFGHAPITEQYPVMSVEPFGFDILAHNFFNENPGLYVEGGKDFGLQEYYGY